MLNLNLNNSSLRTIRVYDDFVFFLNTYNVRKGSCHYNVSQSCERETTEKGGGEEDRKTRERGAQANKKAACLK